MIPWSFKGVIYGHLQSKSNGRKLVRFGKRLASIKSDSARQWWRDTLIQGMAWKQPWMPFKGTICLTARVFYPDRRNDLDISLLMDVLQVGTPKNPGIGVIQNDRQVIKQILVRAIDKERPRVEFWLDEFTA
jgi:hypothetical protein